MDRVTESLLREFATENSFTNRPEDKQFELFSTFIVISMFQSDSFNVDDLVIGGGGDTSIDGLAIIVNGVLVQESDQVDELAENNGYLDVSFVFVQAERSSGFESSKIGEIGFGVEDFFKENPKLPRNECVKKAAKLMSAIYGKSSLFRKSNPGCLIYYVTTGKWVDDHHLTGRIGGVVESLKATKIFGPVTFEPIDAERIRKLSMEAKNAISRTFVFEKKSPLPEIPDVDVAYIGSLPARTFLELVTNEDGTIRKSLFYDNVRDYQGDNKVNLEIKKTITSEQMRARFALMNNGVTIIAKELRNTGDRFTIEDFQIVNGGQTSHVLHENREYLDESVIVPVRIISTKSPLITSSIIRATNRQTAVKDSLLNALIEYNKRLEDFFRSFENGKRLYYERRPKQYASQNVEKSRIVTTDNAIRAYVSFFREEPHRALKGFADVVKGMGVDFFADDHVMEPYYVSAYALYRLESLFRSEELDSKYKPARFQIVFAYRLLVHPGPMPKDNSREMTRLSKSMMEFLWDKDKSTEKFKVAALAVDGVVQGSINSDVVRTKATTDALVGILRGTTKS